MHMNAITKRIWNYLIENNISLTAEWISTHLNIWADWESRHCQDSSEWKLCPSIFRRVCQKFGSPDLDLFASRNCHQLHRYVSWKPDPQCLFADAFSQKMEPIQALCIPTFLPNNKGHPESCQGSSTTHDPNNSPMVNPTMVPMLTKYVSTKTPHSATITRPVEEPKAGKPPTNQGVKPHISGMEHIRSPLQ